MSFYEESSIVITPNAYKAGTLYAINPASGLADMDVTRATAATRVDESGLVNYAEVIGDSILTGNNSTFDTGIGSWVTYNGGTLAHSTDKLEVTLTSGESGARINTNSLISGGQSGKTFKVRARIWKGTSTNSTIAIFIGGAQKFITISPTPTYFEAELTAANTSMLTIYRAGGGGGVGTYFIDDVTVKEVTRDNVPRIDYTGGGCPHILSEPQRTNKVTYSEDFTQWTNTDITFGSDGVSPSGQTNANLIQTGTAGSDQVSKIFTLSATNTTTYSVFIKRVSGAEWVDFFIVKSGFSNSLKVWFNINTGSVGSNNQTGTTTLDNASIESFGNNWYKLNVTTTDTTNNTSFNIRVRTASADSSDTRVNDSSYYLWGMQLEKDSYATSYIPTSGATVTRNQDQFSRDGISSLINSTEGVLFAEIAALANDGTNRIISLSDGTTTNRVSLILSTTTNTIRAMAVSGSTTFDEDHAVTSVLDYNKIALKYKVNDFALWINGVEVDTDNSGDTPTGLDRIVFDVGNGSLFPFFGKVKQLQVYPTALTDEQLIELTGVTYSSYLAMANALNYTIQ